MAFKSVSDISGNLLSSCGTLLVVRLQETWSTKSLETKILLAILRKHLLIGCVCCTAARGFIWLKFYFIDFLEF